MIMCEGTNLQLSDNSCCLCVTVQRRKFLRMKRQKYGYIYRTHLFGNPTVRVTGADNVRQILLGEHRLVSAQWPASVRTILGSDTLSNVHGAQHKTKKKVSGVTASYGTDSAAESGKDRTGQEDSGLDRRSTCVSFLQLA